MKTQSETTFQLNSENISNGFQQAFNWLRTTKIAISSKTGREYVSLPLIAAIVIAVILPFFSILGLLIGTLLGWHVSFQRTKEDIASKSGIIDIK
ncbi:MAG TPA: hypothetical protein VK017_04885 [Sphingobacterium sp.]|jgi:hypothetical protein|nr:hypothetical protein [Sphingobacterium sp.]